MAKKRRRLPATSSLEQVGVLEVLSDLLAPRDLERMVEALAKPHPQSVRINTQKIDPEEASLTWPNWYGWEILNVPFCPTGWQVLSSQIRPSQTPEFKLGFFYIQDAASMLPVELLDFTVIGEPLILDMAAAPGGKSTHLVSCSQDRGLLVANDSSRSRIPALRSSLQDWGAMNTLVTSYSGEKLGVWYPEMFDVVLLDAPCSMENLTPGEAQSGQSKPARSTQERQRLAERQLRMLTSAFQAVKPGGQVVYATCTLAPQEDEAVLDALLSQFPNQAAIDPVADRLQIQAPGLREAWNEVYHPEVQKAVRLWPHIFGTSGFFAARLTKLESLEIQEQQPPQRAFEKTGLTPLDRRKSIQDDFFNRFQDRFGLDLQPILETQKLSLWQREEKLFALPELFLRHFDSLPFEAVGFLLGGFIRDEFIPSHELVARWGRKFTRGFVQISLERVGNWFAGADLDLSGEGKTPGEGVVAVLDERGRLLGRGKQLKDRLKNFLPRRLVT